MSNSTHGTKQPTTSSKKSEWSSYPQSREDSIKTIGKILQSSDSELNYLFAQTQKLSNNGRKLS